MTLSFIYTSFYKSINSNLTSAFKNCLNILNCSWFLQQIFKDSQSVHSIFFEIPTAQRIAIIRYDFQGKKVLKLYLLTDPLLIWIVLHSRQDRELRQERLRKGEEISPRTQLSAVTRLDTFFHNKVIKIKFWFNSRIPFTQLFWLCVIMI